MNLSQQLACKKKTEIREVRSHRNKEHMVGGCTILWDNDLDAIVAL
jgi:hypothetical protein